MFSVAVMVIMLHLVSWSQSLCHVWCCGHGHCATCGVMGAVVAPWVALNHLRREVVECAAECGALVTWCMDAPAKIANFELAINAQEKILRLDISMDDVLGVEVGKCVSHLMDVDHTLPL